MLVGSSPKLFGQPFFFIKGFADRARALCNDKHLAEELKNVKDVFVANGYPRELVRKFMEPRPQQIDKREQEEQENREVVTIPYLKELSEQFRRTANRHSFQVAFKPGRKIKEAGISHTFTSCNGHETTCMVTKLNIRKMIRHIDNFYFF